MAKKRAGGKSGKLNSRFTKTSKQSSKALDAKMEATARRMHFPKQYDRVFDTIRKAPKMTTKRALELTERLSEINAAYSDGAIDLGRRDELFYDDFYEPLDEFYDLDFHEAYQEEK